MKTYADFKEEVQGIIDVREVVKTIEKSSASEIHLLKKKIFSLEKYLENINYILARLSDFNIRVKSVFLEKRKKGKKVLVVIGSDKSLVGGLWHKLINKVLAEIDNYNFLVVLGEKIESFLREENKEILKKFSCGDNFLEDGFKEVNDYLFELFQKEEIVKIDIFYSDFISISEQRIRRIRFLPFDFHKKNLENKKKHRVEIGLPIFENKKEIFFNSLLKKYIESFFYRIMLDSKISEYSSRMLEMEQAAEKSKNLIKLKKHIFLKEKRKSFTQKQLESFNYKK